MTEASRKNVTRSTSRVQQFLDRVGSSSAGSGSTRARIVLAIDATASREPTWDTAVAVQSQMFLETAALGGLDVQLVFYRGMGECRASRWVSSPAELVKLMTGVMCRGGYTQIKRVLDHVAKEHARRPVNAVILVGNACEENPDVLLKQGDALGVKIFTFLERNDPAARFVFTNLAKATGGACLPFDSSAPRQLRALLAGVAAYAAGGQRALDDLARRQPEVLQIAHQLAGGHHG